MNIFITGATGFIGSELVPFLLENPTLNISVCTHSKEINFQNIPAEFRNRITLFKFDGNM